MATRKQASVRQAELQRWSPITPANAQNASSARPARAPISEVSALSGCATAVPHWDISTLHTGGHFNLVATGADLKIFPFCAQLLAGHTLSVHVLAEAAIQTRCSEGYRRAHFTETLQCREGQLPQSKSKFSTISYVLVSDCAGRKLGPFKQFQKECLWNVSLMRNTQRRVAQIAIIQPTWNVRCPKPEPTIRAHCSDAPR
jgi:hypothetical protein